MNGGINLYAYTANNPVNFIDPDGKFYIAAALIHWTRNYWNETVSDISDVNDWTQLTPKESIYHQMGPGNKNNRKFVSPDGHSEAVFDLNDCPVTDSANKGTFNFFGPRTLGGVPHAITDAVPYLVLGNSPSDMFNMDRFTTTIDYLRK